MMDDQYQSPKLGDLLRKDPPEIEALRTQGFGVAGLRKTQSAINSGDNHHDREINSHNHVPQEVTMDPKNTENTNVAPATNGTADQAKQVQGLSLPVQPGTQTIKIEMAPIGAPQTLKSFGVEMGKVAAKAVICTAVALTGRYIYERATRPEAAALES